MRYHDLLIVPYGGLILSHTIILFNPNAGNGGAQNAAQALQKKLGDAELFDMTHFYGYDALFSSLSPQDPIVLVGGDGTLNRFINDTQSLSIKNPIYYCAAGSGNDFLHDLDIEKGGEPVQLNEYLADLPTVTVNGKSYRFLNGVGYGIDGYCCEVGDKMRADGKTNINYAGIAIRGLLFHYRPTHAIVTVDGKRYDFNRVWLAPAMNGRFYGGGMMVTPEQKRLGDGSLSVCIMYGSGKLKTLAVFPSIFKGEHVKHTEMVKVLTGHEIRVEFDRPTALQIDGETILGVTSYTVRSANEKRKAVAAG